MTRSIPQRGCVPRMSRDFPAAEGYARPMRSRLLTGTFLLLLAACGGSAPDATTPGRADAGDPVAQYHLALRHFTGSGAQKDLARAAELYLASAEQGFSPAQVNLGAMYYAGIGVPRDRVESAKWFALAADQDLAEGQANLGVQLLSGDGAEKDLARAAELFRKAGLQGHEQAQENLGLMHLNGDGVEKDTIGAYPGLRVAAASGSPSATKTAGEIEDILSPADLERGLERARAIAAQIRPRGMGNPPNAQED